jgi:hypothetical protein
LRAGHQSLADSHRQIDSTYHEDQLLRSFIAIQARMLQKMIAALQKEG